MFEIKNLLIYILMFPIFGILVILFLPARNEKLLKVVALNSACLSFTGSLLLWGFFQNSIGSFQFVIKILWLPNLNLNFILGLDGISLFFLLLTTLLIPLCLLTSWNSVGSSLKEFLIAFLILDFFLIGTFCVLDLLLFYIFFESVLIPMGRILASFRILQSWMYWYIVIRLTQVKSLYNYGESGDSWMINDVTCLSIKGLIQFLKSGNKRVSLAHSDLTRPTPF